MSISSPRLDTTNFSINEKSPMEGGHETITPRGGVDGEVLADLGYKQGESESSLASPYVLSKSAVV